MSILQDRTELRGAGDDHCIRIDSPAPPECLPGMVLTSPLKEMYEQRLEGVSKAVTDGSSERQKPISERKTSISSRVVMYNKMMWTIASSARIRSSGAAT